MAEKKFLEKLRDEYLAAHPQNSNEELRALLDDFCAFSANWLADNPPTGIGYAAAGLMLRLADGENLLLASSLGCDSFNDSMAIVAPEKLNARAAPDKVSDFRITGR